VDTIDQILAEGPPPGFDKFDESVRRHLATPHITLAQHRRGKIAELLKLLDGRKIIYLDTKFWVYLRQPSLSRAQDTIREIKRLLYAGVEAGKLICPMSFPIYLELQTQPIELRLETAKIMDDLSLGVSLDGPEHVYGTELTRFFIENSSHLRHLAWTVVTAWTKIGTLFGESYPPRGILPEPMETAMDKALFDKLWNATVTDMATLDEEPMKPTSVAEQINEERKQFPRDGKSFQALYGDELHGLLDFNKHLIEASLRDIAGLVLNPAQISTSTAPDQVPTAAFVSLVKQATTMRRGQLGIPMQRTQAALHAFLRLDEQRPFQTNDANDIRHTASAMAYSDVFLTERFFASVANRREIRGVAPLNCQTAWIPEDALALIRAIS
jgi:hypothetical protein